ncbi:MAG: hypothetical protein M3Y29_02905 [Chloroflexota bacterium]|jgi:hypothetical protein|nr:hypothetical protein [Chloroflexota bacterium]
MTIQPPDPDMPPEPVSDIPPELPPDGSPGGEPNWTPGIDDPPMRMPEDSPDVETDL